MTQRAFKRAESFSSVCKVGSVFLSLLFVAHSFE